MMKIALCVDGTEDRERCGRLIKAVAKNYDVNIEMSTFKNGEQLFFALDDPKSAYDIVFVNMAMPKIDGMRIAGKLSASGFPGVVVLLSVSSAYVSQGLDAPAFNYVLKRTERHDEDRFEHIFLSALTEAERQKQRFIPIPSTFGYTNVPIDSIQYFEVLNHICAVHYGADKTIEFVSTLGGLEDMLRSHGFLRIHRSFLVNSAYVQRYTYNEVKLSDDTPLPLGRRYRASFVEAMASRATVRVSDDVAARFC